MLTKGLFIAALFGFGLIMNAQTKVLQLQNGNFDERIAIEQAKAKGMKPSEINGYVQFLKNDFSSKKALQQQAQKHTPYETSNAVMEKVIHLNPASPQSAGCLNMGFEQNNFSGWTGGIGTISTGSGSNALYTPTGASIVNSAGNNVSLANTTNYHTLMSLAATNQVYPNCSGYDSLACRSAGSTIISQIPVVSPFSPDQVSVRMNGAAANYRACRLKYITTTSSSNKQLSFSCALVLENGGHAPGDSPYFIVQVKNETTGTLLPGCQSFTINSSTAVAGDSLYTSVINPGDISYRKWNQYVVDLSSLAPGTDVSVSFEVGGCAQGGHFGYAYVDAECGGNGVVTSNMCTGSASASLVAPQGYASYQWFAPGNTLITGATGYSLTVSSPVQGDVYSVNLTSYGGCVQTQTVAISTSSVSISNITATGSCPAGNSGSATVNVTGSNSALTYTWTSISTGSVVSNSQTASNLTVGSYSVLVNSGNCGAASATISVPVAAAQLSQQSKLFCGNRTFIAQPGGSDYQWYNGTTAVPAPAGVNDTLYINNPNMGDLYTVAFTDPGSCRDSIQYTLSLSSNNSIGFSTITNVCNGNTNGSGVINLFTANAAPYTFNVDGPSGPVINTTVNTTSLAVNALAAGVYTATVYEGTCIHQNTFTVSVIQTNFTMTPNNPGPCSSADTARIGFNFGNGFPTCGLSSSGGCTSTNTIQVGSGTSAGTATSYPAIYGNYYKNSRHQLLFKASELLTAGVSAGKISSIAFNISAVNGATVYPGFTIKLKCTSVANLTTTFDNAGLTQVYYNANQTIVAGWNVYQFPMAYEWDGTSNILVDVCNAQAPNYTSNSSSPFTVTPFTSVSYIYGDVIVACGTSSVATVSSNRPNIKFENCTGINPSTYTISVSSNGTITHNYNNDSIKIVPAVTPAADIVYTITVTNPEGGCTSSQTYTMTSNPSGVITTTNASCGTCPNGSVSVTPSCGAAPYSYIWSPGGQNTQSVGGLLPGCYTVTIMDANGQTADESTCVTFSTKLSEIDAIEGLSVYPNPNNGIFNLLSQTKLESLTVTIINTIGQTVITETVKNTSQVSFDLSKLSKGIYYLKASTNDGSKLFKLILE